MADTMVRSQPPDSLPKRWTRAEFARMLDNGELEGKYELIDGEIISLMGHGWLHGYIVMELLTALLSLFDARCVRPQLPVLPTGPGNEYDGPQPDMVVTPLPNRAYRELPNAADLLLVVEISVSTLSFDLGKKAGRYAIAGVRDYWVIDANARQLHILRDPTPEGYKTVTIHAEDETVSLLLRPDASLRLADLLPAPEDVAAGQ